MSRREEDFLFYNFFKWKRSEIRMLRNMRKRKKIDEERKEEVARGETGWKMQEKIMYKETELKKSE